MSEQVQPSYEGVYPNTAEHIQQLIDLLKTANEATAAMAEVARVQAHSVLAVVQRDNLQQKLDTAEPALAQAETAPPQTSERDISAGMVISSRVGSISTKDWEEMSSDRLRDLDRVLRKIVDTALVSKVSWSDVGKIIQRELATIGFVFSTVYECPHFTDGRDVRDAEDKTLPDLVRMRSAVDLGKRISDRNMWVGEMARITLRLMELRNM